jgi:hypothetical protein
MKNKNKQKKSNTTKVQRGFTNEQRTWPFNDRFNKSTSFPTREILLLLFTVATADSREQRQLAFPVYPGIPSFIRRRSIFLILGLYFIVYTA